MNVDFGTRFPENHNAQKGDLFIRVDMLPNKLYKFTSQNWIEIPKSRTTTYLDNQEYIDYLSSKVQRGEIEMEDLTPQEQDDLKRKVAYDKE